jgi:hypothetical protein
MTGGQTRPAAPSPPRLPTRLDTLCARGVDLLLDAVAVAFAAWTLAYDVAMAADHHARTAQIAWLVLAGFGVCLVLSRWRERSAAPGDGDGESPAWPSQRRTAVRALALLALVCAAIAAIGVGSDNPPPPWTLVWGAASIAALLVAAMAVIKVRASGNAKDEGAPPRTAVPRGAALALLIAVGLGGLSLFVHRPDADDVFYVNRAQWVADHGTYATRDTIFSAGVLDPVGHPPITAYEPMLGTVARLAHRPAGTIAYLVIPPIGTAVAVLAIWLLLLEWRVRMPLVALSVSMIFLLMGGAGNALFGNVFLGRMWQGKIIFVSAVVPLLYVRVAEWARRPTRKGLLMLLLLGVAAAGLTTTAPLLVPLIGLAAVLPAALRAPRHAVAALVAVSLYPLIAGVIIRTSRGGGGSEDASTLGFNDPLHVLTFVLGHGWYAGLALLGILAGWLAIRRASGRLSAAAAVLIAMAVLAPPVFREATAHIGSSSSLWRLMWVVPVAPLVGALATAIPLQRVHRALALVPAVALAILLVWSGVPIWSSSNGAMLTGSPQWKVDATSLAEARIIAAHAEPGTTVVAPLSVSNALAVLTTSVHAADPRSDYVRGRPVAEHPDERLLLTTLAGTGVLSTAAPVLVTDLELLQPSLICTNPGDGSLDRALTDTGSAPAFRAGALACFIPPRTPV